MADILDILRPALAAALAATTPASPSLAAPTRLAADALDAVRDDPAVQHALNAEPWYRSRVTLGAILSAAAPALGLFGIALTPEHQDAIAAAMVALGGIVGPLLTLYGRWAATRPIGS